MSTIVDSAGLPTPGNEGQARELVRLKRSNGEGAMLEVWRGLVAEFGDSVTAKLVNRKRQALDIHGQRQPSLPGAEEPEPEPRENWQLSWPRTQSSELRKALDCLGREWGLSSREDVFNLQISLPGTSANFQSAPNREWRRL